MPVMRAEAETEEWEEAPAVVQEEMTVGGLGQDCGARDAETQQLGACFGDRISTIC